MVTVNAFNVAYVNIENTNIFRAAERTIVYIFLCMKIILVIEQ